MSEQHIFQRAAMQGKLDSYGRITFDFPSQALGDPDLTKQFTDGAKLFTLGVDVFTQAGRLTEQAAKEAYVEHAVYVNSEYGSTAVTDADSPYLGLTVVATENKALITAPSKASLPPVRRLDEHKALALTLFTSNKDTPEKQSQFLYEMYQTVSYPANEIEMLRESYLLNTAMYWCTFSDTFRELTSDNMRYREIAALITYKYGPIVHLGSALAEIEHEGKTITSYGDSEKYPSRPIGFIGMETLQKIEPQTVL